jgi:hypothetical protein
MFATSKNVNYLPNVLSIMDAEDRGAFASVWVDEQGFVAEGPMVNVAFVTPAGELVLPAFDKILSGCTAKRLLALAPKLVDAGMLTGVTTKYITVDEAKTSVEMAFVGSGLPVLPIVEWDGQPIGEGTDHSTLSLIVVDPWMRWLVNSSLRSCDRCREGGEAHASAVGSALGGHEVWPGQGRCSLQVKSVLPRPREILRARAPCQEPNTVNLCVSANLHQCVVRTVCHHSSSS